jgi:Uma2 family endonuclease
MAIADFSQLDLSRSYSYADYLSWQFPEMVELIRGKVVQMSPAPGSLHQTISANLSILFGNKLKKSSFRLFAAPSDVRLLRKGIGDETVTTVVQPDLFVVCDASKIDEKGCLGSPDLIVEILSPYSSRQDLEVKFGLYEEASVGEYWVVFPAERVIQVFLLEDGQYKLSGQYTPGSDIPVHTIPGFSFPVLEVFEW